MPTKATSHKAKDLMSGLTKVAKNRALGLKYVRRATNPATRMEEEPGRFRPTPASSGAEQSAGTPAAAQTAASKAGSYSTKQATFSAGNAQSTDQINSTRGIDPRLWFGMGIVGAGALYYYMGPGSSAKPDKHQENDVHQLARQQQTSEAALRRSPDVATNQPEPVARESKIESGQPGSRTS
ncbi:hypothetical protein WJX72_007635 [[Myrmecia] bisecta]|uniref:Uncharacterized protein n=1 Tax=[Myrmecia] bisecta TaxID=41462 RepID=A0AAW1QSL6_9CHLO